MPEQRNFRRTATIAVGATESDPPVDMDDLVLVGIITPSTVAGTSLGLKAKGGNTALNTVYDDAGDAVAIAMGANRFIAVSPTTVPGAAAIVLVSNAAASGAAETYTLVGRSVA